MLQCKKNSIYQQKKLKDKNISITENLTKLRKEKLQEARKTHGRLNVWTYNSRIIVKPDNKIKVFHDEIVSHGRNVTSNMRNEMLCCQDKIH